MAAPSHSGWRRSVRAGAALARLVKHDVALAVRRRRGGRRRGGRRRGGQRCGGSHREGVRRRRRSRRRRRRRRVRRCLAKASNDGSTGVAAKAPGCRQSHPCRRTRCRQILPRQRRPLPLLNVVPPASPKPPGEGSLIETGGADDEGGFSAIAANASGDGATPPAGGIAGASCPPPEASCPPPEASPAAEASRPPPEASRIPRRLLTKHLLRRRHAMHGRCSHAGRLR